MTYPMRKTPRRRRPVSPAVLKVVRPLFRYSTGRDAYVLRGVGGAVGPVLTVRSQPAAVSSAAEAAAELTAQASGSVSGEKMQVPVG
jgi:hypothetical protein